VTNKQILFVSGVARSGTSELVNVLNCHPDVLVGNERYSLPIRQGRLEQDMFRKARFLDVRPGDTNGRGFGSALHDLPARYDQATYVGDKYPSLYNYMDWIFEDFPDAAHVYIFRNPFSVAASYEARRQDPDDKWVRGWRDALDEWNTSLNRILSLSPAQRATFHIVPYELYFSEVAYMNLLFRELGLNGLTSAVLAPVAEEFRKLSQTPQPRLDDLRRKVGLEADWDAYRAMTAWASENWGPAALPTAAQ